MARLLVHLHIYYPAQTEHFLRRLKRIKGSIQWDLLVTMSVKDASVGQKIRAFRPDALIYEVENAGYDVWPFIKVLQYLPAGKYDYILKLHTKNYSRRKDRVNGICYSKYRWRNTLENAILCTPGRFRWCIRQFEKNPSLGLLYSYELAKKTSRGLPEDLGMLRTEAARIGVSDLSGHFCAGTMFLARVEAFATIARADITAEMFQGPSAAHSVGSMAHVYERLLCFAVNSSGYTTRLVPSYLRSTVLVFLHNITSPLAQFLFSLNRVGEDSHKELCILGIKFNLGK